MAVLEIRTFPDEVLRQVAIPVEQVDADVRRLMDDMVETMYAHMGIGLAAPQVGVSKRVIAVHVQIEDEDDSPLIVLANPEVTEASEEIEIEEGCLSLPGFLVPICRYRDIKVKGLNREGKMISINATGLFSVALQHEIDHLDGKLIIDSASPIKKAFYNKRIKKQTAEAG
jgi:peptide deformylase